VRHILDTLGLTKEEVSNFFNTKDSWEPTNQEDKNYLLAVDQKRIRRRLKENMPFIVTRFMEGYKPRLIAKMMGVSEESIRGRLRKLGVFKSDKKPGRPRSKSATQCGLHDQAPFPTHSILEDTISLGHSQADSESADE
jgi:hypothetical protein